MDKDKFLRLIRESKEIFQHSSIEQRIKYLKLIKEEYHKLKKQQEVTPNTNNDYIDEI